MVGIREDNIVITYNNIEEIKVIPTVRVKHGEMNEIAVRVRNDGEARIWLNGFDVSIETLGRSYQAGIYSKEASYECYLFEIRDSYNMYLQEAITITTPYGTEKLGRIDRNVERFDDIYSRIYIPTGEEIDTRLGGNISDEWDYLHSSEFEASGEFEISVLFNDIGLWLRRVILVDSEGASIAFYNDIFSYMYWFNESSNRYKFKGVAIWCTGEENPEIYKYLDKEV